MRHFLLPTLLFFISILTIRLSAQCPSGEIGVSSANCGCLSGCNLTSFGGPDCGGATGNCSAGEVAMSADIIVPAGCTFTVSGTMGNRPGCSASGADSGDKMKVDIPGGSKSLLTGASNATLNDSYTLTGPGTIRVSGTANRADEIITYTTISTGCINCATALGIELESFTSEPEGRTVKLTWTTASETNTDYFIIDRSGNGIDFEAIGGMQAAGNSNSLRTYTNYDSSPLDGIGYYRIKQVDLDGKFTYTPIRSVMCQESGKALVSSKSGRRCIVSSNQSRFGNHRQRPVWQNSHRFSAGFTTVRRRFTRRHVRG